LRTGDLDRVVGRFETLPRTVKRPEQEVKAAIAFELRVVS
jgi:hypothetical protein